MNKLLQIAPWKVYLWLLSPFIVMLILTNLKIGEASIHSQYNLQFYTIFGILGVFLIFSYQYIVGLAFFKERQMSAWLFKINGLIPILFYLLLFVYTLYGFSHFLDRQEIIVARANKEMRPVNLGFISTLFKLFLLHSLLTLFINNKQVRKAINTTADPDRRNRYLLTYLKPMKTVSWTLIFGIVLIFGYAVFYDITQALK